MRVFLQQSGICLGLGLVMMLNAAYPACGDHYGFASRLGTFTEGILGVAFVIVVLVARSQKSPFVRWIPAFLMFVFTMMISSGRNYTGERLRWTIDGVVTEKYLAKNRGGAPSFKIGPADDQDFEGVDLGFWDKLKPGDRVKKATCSSSATINGTRLSILPVKLRSQRLPN